MKFALTVIVALLIGVTATWFAVNYPGYVAIDFLGYRIEMNLIVLVGLIVLVLLAAWALRRLLLAPRLIGEAAARYRAGRAGEKLTVGMIQVAEGNFARGEKLLARAASTSDTPLFNYLQAARAAHLQGEDQRRDDWLKLAYEETPEAGNAVLLTQAEFQLDRGQLEQALATLKQLEENARDHSYALALMGRLYARLEDWDSLRAILPKLARQGRVRADLLETWTLRVHEENLRSSADAVAIDAAWKEVPKSHRANLRLLEAYYEALIRCGEATRAEKELTAALKSEWRGPLVRLYGLVETDDASKQLKRAESWLAKHGDDPDLLLTAARLCLRNELWGKARSYLETVISLRPTPEAYRDYGQLLTRLGETDAAAEAYREGLAMVSAEPLPAIPHLDADG